MKLPNLDDLIDLFGSGPHPRCFEYFNVEDLVSLGLYEDVTHVHRAIRGTYNVPPYVRFSRSDVRFPLREFREWLSAQTWLHKCKQKKK
jgi:hypothetical protein